MAAEPQARAEHRALHTCAFSGYFWFIGFFCAGCGPRALAVVSLSSSGVASRGRVGQQGPEFPPLPILGRFSSTSSAWARSSPEVWSPGPAPELFPECVKPPERGFPAPTLGILGELKRNPR